MFPEDIRPLLVVTIPVIGALLIFVSWVNTRSLPSFEEAAPPPPKTPEA